MDVGDTIEPLQRLLGSWRPRQTACQTVLTNVADANTVALLYRVMCHPILIGSPGRAFGARSQQLQDSALEFFAGLSPAVSTCLRIGILLLSCKITFPALLRLVMAVTNIGPATTSKHQLAYHSDQRHDMLIWLRW